MKKPAFPSAPAHFVSKKPYFETFLSCLGQLWGVILQAKITFCDLSQGQNLKPFLGNLAEFIRVFCDILKIKLSFFLFQIYNFIWKTVLFGVKLCGTLTNIAGKNRRNLKIFRLLFFYFWVKDLLLNKQKVSFITKKPR